MQITFWEASTFKGIAHTHFPVQYSCKLIQWKIQCTLQHVSYLQAELYCCHIFSFFYISSNNLDFFFTFCLCYRKTNFIQKERASNSVSFAASSLRIFLSSQKGHQNHVGWFFPWNFSTALLPLYSTIELLPYPLKKA